MVWKVLRGSAEMVLLWHHSKEAFLVPDAPSSFCVCVCVGGVGGGSVHVVTRPPGWCSSSHSLMFSLAAAQEASSMHPEHNSCKPISVSTCHWARITEPFGSRTTEIPRVAHRHVTGSMCRLFGHTVTTVCFKFHQKKRPSIADVRSRRGDATSLDLGCDYVVVVVVVVFATNEQKLPYLDYGGLV